MFRLTVGRRLALIVAVAVGLISLLVFTAFRDQSDAAVSQSADQLASIADPLATLIENEIENAINLVAVVAATNSDDSPAELATQLAEAGFIASEVLESPEDESTLGATSNFLERASVAPTVGATRLLDDEVGVLLGAPIANSNQILLGAYDSSGILVAVSGVRSGESTEALLAVRNSQGEAVIFSPSRHNDDMPIGEPDATTTALLNGVFDGADSIDVEDVEINGRDSLASLRRVPQVEWVLIVARDSDDAASFALPQWLIPAIVAVGLFALIPIAILRSRLGRVEQAAQELYKDRLMSPLEDNSEDEIGILARTIQSLDERLRTEADRRSRSAASLQHQANHDPLTGLANRGKLVEELTIALNNRDPVGVLFCDIDNFKGINDSQGHEAGDNVLKFVANQLASVCGPKELIARFGGDEFCVLTRSEAQGARDLAGRVDRALDSTCVVNDTQLRISGSVGLAVAKVTDTPDSVLKSADLAMYREKERRRGLRRSANAEQDDVEISVEQIRLVYQPVVEITDGNIVGVEVLARYMHPVLGMLDPSSFLPRGTELGMFDKFDLEILTRSIAQLGEWLGRGVVDESFSMSVNLKPDHVSDSDSTKKIFEILRQHRVPATMLQIEVTEHRLHTHEDDLLNSLHRLRKAGIKIAIDDFGVEQSNIDRLVEIPSDTVKIDRKFVAEIDTDEKAQARLKAILEILDTMTLRPIAEGVERTAQADVLRELGVGLGQGYLWHAPISAVALTPLLGRASRWTRRRQPSAG